MAYTIKQKKAGIFEKLKEKEKVWEEKRAEAKKEKEIYEAKRKKHEAKLQKIYDQEKKKLAKEKEATDEIERIRQLKERARKEVYGLTPQEKAQQEKEWGETKKKGWEIAGKVIRFVTPKPEKKRKRTKAEIKEQKEWDEAWEY